MKLETKSSRKTTRRSVQLSVTERGVEAEPLRVQRLADSYDEFIVAGNPKKKAKTGRDPIRAIFG